MYLLKVNDEQLEFLFSLLDKELRSNGLTSLANVVSLHNVLTVATEKEEIDEEFERAIDNHRT